MIYTVKGRP